MKFKLTLLILVLLGSVGIGTSVSGRVPSRQIPTKRPTITRVVNTATPTRTATPTYTPVSTVSSTATLENTLTPTLTATPSATRTPTNTPSINIAPYPDASLCTDHNDTKWHSLWDSTRGCHYDHTHRDNPFTSQVVEMFSVFDMLDLLGGNEVCHTNPSSPTECHSGHGKHGGLKWNVQLRHPQTCLGFEGAPTGVNGSVIQLHGFGDYEIEAEARFHSSVAFLRQCESTNPTDYGYIFVNALQDYGQRIAPYQGDILPYPNNPVPAYNPGGGPYLTQICIDLIAPYDAHCRAGFENAQANRGSSVWSSKPTAGGVNETQSLFQMLWRVEDIYKGVIMNNWPNASYPLEFLWLCSNDNGQTLEQVGCEYNNSTGQVHEIKGTIPVGWDNLSGWDTDSRVGRVTAQGYVDGQGDINTACSEAGADCYPISLVRAFTGPYGSVLVFTDGKGQNVVPINPEYDMYFCNGVVCSSNFSNAIPSGWIGAEN